MPLILVVIVMLTLAGYVYTEMMMIERTATAAFERKAQSKAAADSGAEYVAALLNQSEQRQELGLSHRPDLFRGISLNESLPTRSMPRFTVVVPNPKEGAAFPVRFGLLNESGKLNLNQLLAQTKIIEQNYSDSFGFDDSLQSEEDFQRTAAERLLVLPGMQPDIADAILDWLDADDELRPYGAEQAYYQSAPGSPAPRNGPLQTLDELLFVRGVTRDLLYGEDTNRNGMLDAHEDDNGDGRLERGWAAYLTVDSRESRFRLDGRPKIHLNQESLESLYDEIQAEFGSEAARFVTAFRLVGPFPDDIDEWASFGSTESGGVSSGTPKKTRGGLVLDLGGNYEIFSLYELVESRVEVEIEGRMQILESPWQIASLPEVLPKLMNHVSISNTPPPARINLFEASRETLRTVPGLNESVIEAVVSHSSIGPNGELYEDMTGFERTPGWLLTSGLVDLPMMRRLDHYLTAGGCVFRCQVMGTVGTRGPITRLEVLVEASKKPSRFLSYIDITDLGQGFPWRQWFIAPEK